MLKLQLQTTRTHEYKRQLTHLLFSILRKPTNRFMSLSKKDIAKQALPSLAPRQSLADTLVSPFHPRKPSRLFKNASTSIILKGYQPLHKNVINQAVRTLDQK